MMGAGAALQAAAVAALETAPGIGGVYDGPPLQAAFPYALVEAGPESDWGYKGCMGREVRLAVTLREQGERPARLHRLMAEAETAMGDLSVLEGWSIVTMRLLRSRVAKDARGPWSGMIEYRARMLSTAAAG